MAKTVLVVDDIAFVRSTLVAILTEAHFKVVGEAGDGKEAVDLYRKLRPDLVTMDIVMPKMSGIEASRQIMRENPDARVVMVSAMGQEHLVIDAINAGARDFILKPFSAEDVIRAMSRALSNDPTGVMGAALGGSSIARGAGTPNAATS